MNKWISLGFIFLFTACASRPEVVQRIPFNPNEFASLATTGTAVVKGKAFIKTADGKTHYPENAQARLNPVTSYSKQWYEVNYLGKKNIADADPRYLKHMYKAGFDPEGNFQFNNIPAGNYYISAPIFWIAEIKREDGSIFMQQKGKFICHEIHVEEGLTVVKDLTANQSVDVASSK